MTTPTSVEAGFRGNPERTECCGVLVSQKCEAWCVNAEEEEDG